MSYCLNPNCLSPQNPDDAKYCQRCQTRLLLNERYRPLDPIGRGGFGRTFKARDEYKPSKPNCVIKQFHGKGFGDAAKAEELFHREAELQEMLGKHPQIPELLALCPQDNYLYLVQEFIDGRNLNQELKEEGTFSEEKVWQLLEDLLPVLQFVHGNQVIHRDIKPENIIRHSVDKKLFLVDFGIAKLATEAILAKTATAIGSEGYTAPEQHDGKPRFASDLYSLGATCYHLLTYADPSRLLYSWVDWQKELKEKLENRDISNELIDVLTKLLQPDLSQRYQSAEEVLRDLNLPTQATAESSIVFPVSTSKPRTQSWKCINTLTGHRWYVISVAISPDGQILASGATDHNIKIWNLHTRELLHTLKHSGDVNSLAFTPSGEILVSTSWDKTIKTWNHRTGQLRNTLSVHSSSVNSIAISSDGQTVASGSGDKTIKLWRRPGELLYNLTEHSGSVFSLTISPDSQTLASGSKDKTIKLWNLDTGKLLRTLSEHSESVFSLAISPDGQTLASGSKDKTIKLWNLSTGELLNTLCEHSDSVRSVTFSPDGQTLASGSDDSTIKIWHLSTGELLTTLTEHSQCVNSVTFSPDGQTLASGSDDSTIKIWQCD
ncbi:protein kinase [Microcoleus sp. FACHB-53]|nr:protein kinase [Microcoleus sp. FACHB-53]